MVPAGVATPCGCVVDLSPDGVQLLVPGKPEQEPFSIVTVVLISELGEVRVRGRIAWSEELLDRRHVMGVAFVDPDQTAREQLHNLIRHTCSGHALPTCHLAA